ncbi:hypothetical protein Ahy_B08g093309 [Arachis hypogaea]|uniref:Zinc finger PMZ-type domain-containing protein n=1 Tax=Arachis hypogaea TaxID=3818 RepID=A0A444Y5Y2_ARAHY|nr:hypothetical protein Ahy_B08g093309 [Arachis hypogaea]
MCFAAQKNDGVVDVYSEHGVSTPEVIAGKEVVVWLDDTCKGDLNRIPFQMQTQAPKTILFQPPETNPVTIPNPIDDNTTPNPNSARAHDKPILKPNSKSKPKPKSKRNPTSISKPKMTKNPIQKPNPSLKTKLRETTKACSTAKGKGKSKMKSKPQFLPKRITRSQATGTYRRSANKGKKSLHVDLTVNDDSSDDNSSENSSFKPIQEDSSSSENNASMSKLRNRKLKEVKRGAYAAAKTKENIMQPDDALVEDVSDREVDLGFIGTPGVVDVYEALDPGAESNGANSWHSAEMKTPPNSEDDLQSDEDSDEFPIFRNIARFGELQLQVGIPCVHACAALARINKRPEDFCHQMCTMEAYNKTYAHHINPLPGQSLWEKSMYTQPQAPNIRRRPRALTKKRRKDADEGNSGNKKAKPSGSLKRILKPFTCRYCGGHTKRGCSKKRLDEVAAAVAVAKAAADKAKSKAALEAGPQPHTAASASQAGPQPQTATSASDLGPQPHTAAAPVDKPSVVEIEISQPNYEGSQNIAGSTAPAPSRPEKLLTKRKSSPPSQPIRVDPMQGANEATSFRLANFMNFVPTPNFRAPRKKNN